jgi:hypothetical protein
VAAFVLTSSTVAGFIQCLDEREERRQRREEKRESESESESEREREERSAK